MYILSEVQMKLLIKLVILIIASPYLIFSHQRFIEWYEYPPIVSQERVIAEVQATTIIGNPINSNSLELCSEPWRDFKSYMYYTSITAKSSQQYKFISAYMDTTSEDGLLRLKSDTQFIGVALGSYFGEIGSKFKFTLEEGIVLYAIKVEEKSDNHTYDGCVHNEDASIIEFVVNAKFKSFYPEAVNAGSLHVLPQFKGMITEIEKIN